MGFLKFTMDTKPLVSLLPGPYLNKGASINYVDKPGGGEVCQMSTLVNEGVGESWSYVDKLI